MAARVARDTADTAETKPFDLDAIIASAKKTLDETFTKENLDVSFFFFFEKFFKFIEFSLIFQKFTKQAQALGESLSEKVKEASNKIKDATTKTAEGN